MGSKTESTLGISSMNRNYPRLPRHKPIQQTNWGTLHITFPPKSQYIPSYPYYVPLSVCSWPHGFTIKPSSTTLRGLYHHFTTILIGSPSFSHYIMPKIPLKPNVWYIISPWIPIYWHHNRWVGPSCELLQIGIGMRRQHLPMGVDVDSFALASDPFAATKSLFTVA